MIIVVVVQGPRCLPLIFLEPQVALSSLGFVVLWGGEPEVVTVLVVSQFSQRGPDNRKYEVK